MIEMDTVFKNNNFDTLEIEQGDTANWETFIQEKLLGL